MYERTWKDNDVNYAYPYGKGSLYSAWIGLKAELGLSIILSTKIGFSTYSTYFTDAGGGERYT